MNFKKILIALFALLAGNLNAQQSTLKGSVVDDQQEPVIRANVSLRPLNDTSLVLGQATDSNGYFELLVSPGYYTLEISYVGYQKFREQLLIEYKTVDLGKVTISEKAVKLGEITVIGEILPVIVKGDTTEINAAAYKSNPDADAGDLIEKMPTIVVQDGKVQAEGEDVKKVLVDGKPFFGDDPNAALSSLPAEAIDKVQIFDDLSDQAKLTGFDDGESEKTLNIITKKAFRNGTFGNVSGGYGTEDRYRVNGLLNNFKEERRLTIMTQTNNINQQNFSSADLAGVTSGNSRRGRRGGGGRPGGNNASDFLVGEQNGIVQTHALGLNYTDEFGEKLSLNTSYFFNQTDNKVVSLLERTYFIDHPLQQYFEDEAGTSANQNHRANLRLRYQISRSDAIIYSPGFTLQNYSGFSQQRTANLQDGSLINATESTFNSGLLSIKWQNRLMWQHKFGKRGRTLSMHLSQTYDPTDATSSLYSASGEFLLMEEYDQQVELEQFDQVYSTRLMYTEPVGRKMMVRINYSPSIHFGESRKSTYDYSTVSDTYDQLNSTFSNDFESRYQLQSGGAGLMYRMGKGMLMFNANYQYSVLESTQIFPTETEARESFSAILPMARYRIQLSDKRNLRLILRTNTAVPALSDLQEVLDNSNPQSLRIGNQELDQQYKVNVHAHFNSVNTKKSSTFFLKLGGSLTNNYIGSSTYIAGADAIEVNGIEIEPGIQLTLPVNLNGHYSLQMFSTYGLPITAIKSNLNLNLSAQYNRIPGLLNGALNYTDNPSAGLGAVISSNISSRLDFTVSSNSSMNYSLSSLSPDQSTQYFSQTTSLKLYWNIWDGLVYRSNLSHQYFAGLSDTYDSNYTLWSMGLAYKFMENDRAEFGLEAFDILGQNQNLSRVTNELYYQDIETTALSRYLMLTFRYNFGKYNLGG
ncbi:MAG: hypothetical protein GYB31_05705 [Bacteroidetes bacterium]|nr:hypothetical protein [Bacteroidota bacterium]